jgi:hypothetical protein
MSRRESIAAMARAHLSPLGVLELAAFAAALIMGWKLIALAILAIHVLHMGVAAYRHRPRR